MKYKLIYYTLWTLSLLPWCVLFFIADIFCFFVHRVVGYRRRVVRANLRSAFPGKPEKELRRIERDFYRFFCDLFVEVVKQVSMNREQMMRHMVFTGCENIQRYFDEGAQFVFVMLGHYGNWEWLASLQYWMPEVHCTQIYHKLYDSVANQVLLDVREGYGGECIKMKDTFRRLLELRRTGRKTVVGFIADQQPKWNAIHHFTPFLNHDTAVFTGSEQLGKRLHAAFVYGHVTRPRRGYYRCEMMPMTGRPEEFADFDLTDLYLSMLEKDICDVPHLWLWSHKRWTRTKEKWEERQRNRADG